jgi:imidazolonepropionase-like amidohydrolase
LLNRPRDVQAEAIEPGIAQAPYPLAANYRSVLNNPRPATRDPGPSRQSILKVLYDNGVPIVAGTDGALPGYSLLREVELYVQAGFTPLQAIQAATRVSARALSQGAEMGTITLGKRADFVVLDANPLTDISAIRRTRFVVTNGKMYEPTALWRLAGFRAAK